MLEKLPGQVVTATAFVRNFGAYSRSAGQEPVHILNHGRPAWSLVTTDYLTSLSHGRQDAGSDQALDLFVDSINVQVIITDAALKIIRTNPAARHAFRLPGDHAHMALSSALFDQKLIVQAAERVLRSGMPEEMDMDGAGLRTFRVKIESFGEGVALLAEETTPQIVARERDAKVSAYEAMIDALPGVARGGINGRGLIVQATSHLAELVQSSPDRVEGMRLSALFHTATRSVVNEAIEGLLAHRREFTLSAQLQADGLSTVPVTLTALPTFSGASDERAVFLLVQKPS